MAGRRKTLSALEEPSVCSNSTLKFFKENIVSSGSTRATSLGEFLNLWEAGERGSPPFTKFCLDSWVFYAEDEEQEQQRFLRLVGRHVTSLTLEWCSFFGEDYFRKVIFQAFPNLQFLKMERCKVDNRNYWNEPEKGMLQYKEPASGVHGLKSLVISDFLPYPMMDLLSNFDKLESLHLVKAPSLALVDYQNLLETIGLIRAQDRRKLPLKDFDVGFTLESGGRTASSIELLKLHEKLNLPLQNLTISFSWPLDPKLKFEEVIRNILECHAGTLKCLKFEGDNRHCLPNRFASGFCLDNLKELVIRNLNLSGNLNFLRYTPQLRILKIVNVEGDSDNLFSNCAQLEVGNWSLSTLTDLTMDVSPLSPCGLGKLVKWMPNAEFLRKVKLDDVKFAMVCNYWKKLKALQDVGEELSDVGVVGMGNARGPNIMQLKDLTSFETRSSRLTSASVHNGFIKLAKLKDLIVGKSTKFDDQAEAALIKEQILCNYVNESGKLVV